MVTVEQLAERVQALAELPAPRVRRALRQAAGVSLAEIGDVLGVTREAVRKWELGHARPNAEHLGAYLELLAMFKRTVDRGGEPAVSENETGRPPERPADNTTTCADDSTDFTRARRALAAIIQGREALADGDSFFAAAVFENAETELASFLAEAA